MRLSYFHHLAGNDPAMNHAREFADAVTAMGYTMSVHAMNGDQGGAGDVRPSVRRALRRRMAPYLHEAKVLLSNPKYVRQGLSVVKSERPDVIVARHHYLDASALTVARLTRTPLVLEMNSLCRERRLYPNQYVRIPFVDERIEAAVVRGASRLLVVTRGLGRFVIERYGVHPDKVIVNHNGANLSPRQPGTDRNRVLGRFGLTHKKIVGFAGGLHSWRRPDLLVEIIARLAVRHDVGFLLVGDGPDWAAFRKRLADANLLARVALAGRVDHAIIAQYLSAMDVALLPASAFYMSPLKLFEYMAAGVPAVAPRCEAIEEIVSDGDTGLLFSPENAEEAAHCVGRLLDNEGKRREIGEAAVRRVAANFTWRHNAERALAACHAAMAPHLGTAQESAKRLSRVGW